MSEGVLIAVIAAFGVMVTGLPAALIERARRENTADHALVRRTLEDIDDHLDEIEDAVDDIAQALSDHIGDTEAHGGRDTETAGESEDSSHDSR